MIYDNRAATYSRYEATFSTLNSTVTCRYELPAELEGTPYGEYLLDRRWSVSASKLVFDGQRFWLHAVMRRQFGDDPVCAPQADNSSSDTPAGTHRVLGVELNVDGATAVTSTGQFYGNADALTAYRSEQEQLGGELQQTGTRSAHLRSNQLVASAETVTQQCVVGASQCDTGQSQPDCRSRSRSTCSGYFLATRSSAAWEYRWTVELGSSRFSASLGIALPRTASSGYCSNSFAST